MPAGNYITESKFNAVKIMINGGATNSEIAEYLNVSTSTVVRIKQVQTWEEYQNLRKGNAFIAKKKADEKKKLEEQKKAEEQPKENVQVIEHRQSITVQATEYMMRELKQQNEYLRIISNKLCAIIDDLYGTGAAK